MPVQNNLPSLAIIGGGHGGKVLIELFTNTPVVKIIGIADLDPKAPGMVLARQLRIPCATDFRKILKHNSVNLVMNVTGNAALEKEIALAAPQAEIIGGHSARFMWEMIDTQIRSRNEIERLLLGFQTLQDLGQKLTASENLDTLYNTIVEYANHLTLTPAGSLTILDEKLGEMSLVAVRGFSKQFSSKTRFKLRQGGLTSYILNQDGPLAITDVRLYPKFDNPIMLREGIRSLIASSLKAEGKIMGILYVDDFKPRQFTHNDIALLEILSNNAGMAIDKTKLLESTQLLAITDELTGLYNHRHFLQQLNLETSRAERYHRVLSLLMIDIDHFKHYNDTNGHLKGNDVLSELGRVLNGVSRDVDIVARYGGEEFTIIMPETELKEARILSERLLKRIESHPFENARKQPNKKLTVSIGVASYPENAKSAFYLIEEADKALYEAKRAGRNTVRISHRKMTRAGGGAHGRHPYLGLGIQKIFKPRSVGIHGAQNGERKVSRV